MKMLQMSLGAPQASNSTSLDAAGKPGMPSHFQNSSSSLANCAGINITIAYLGLEVLSLELINRQMACINMGFKIPPPFPRSFGIQISSSMLEVSSRVFGLNNISAFSPLVFAKVLKSPR